MRKIEMEIECRDQEEADRLTDRLMNCDSWIGMKHGKWVLFITCQQDRILYLGQELHYELDVPSPAQQHIKE